MNWTERYLAAALRSIPEPKRVDVERELRSSIEDGIEERVGAGEDRAAAERAVLEGLGDPTVLASAYTGKPNYLIGPDLFPIWRSVVPKILGTAVPIVAFITASVSLADGGTIQDALALGISSAIGTGIQIAFWSTLFFVFLERADSARQARDEVTSKMGTWKLERLPAATRQGISISETVGELVTVGATAIGLLVAGSLSVAGPNGAIPIAEPSLGTFWTPFLFATLLALGVIHVFVYTVGRWTMGFAALYAIVEIAWAAPIVWLALQGSLINPAFAEHIGYPALSSADGPAMVGIAIFASIFTAWEIFDAFRKARRAPLAGGLNAGTAPLSREA
jgi:hypothetical protein